MDLLTLQRKSQDLGQRGFPMTASADGAEGKKDRILDLVKRVKATKPVKNRWGSKDQPINVEIYGEFLSALQTLSWVLKDMGFGCLFLTRNGISYDTTDYHTHSVLFDPKQAKIVALVALSKGKDLNFKIARDNKTLRIKRYTDEHRAVAPMPAGSFIGSKSLDASTVKELVEVMKRHTNLDPDDADSLKKFGRLMANEFYQPKGASVFQSKMKMEFRKVT